MALPNGDMWGTGREGRSAEWHSEIETSECWAEGGERFLPKRQRRVTFANRGEKRSRGMAWGATVHGMHPFEVMAEPIRRRIIEIIASGEHTAGTLTDVVRLEFSVSRSAVSKHLAVLRETGWAHVRVEENRRLYILAPEAMRALRSEYRSLKKLWDHRYGWATDNDAILAAGVHDYPATASHRGMRGKTSDGFTVGNRSRERGRAALHGPAPELRRRLG